jgi:hypothetical protein
MSDFAQIRFQPNRPLLRELSADRLNTILQEIKRNKPKGERGITVRQDGTGTYIGLAASLPRGGGTSTPATFHPFQITSFADPESNPEFPSYLVSVRPGTINNLLPTNILDGESLATFALPANTFNYVVLSCAAASNALTSCEIALESSPPSAQTPLAFALPTTYEVTLGIVYNTSVYQIVTTNLSVGSVQACITDKANPTPGSLPYNVFLQWG